jgi:PAS domain-containing protein
MERLLQARDLEEVFENLPGPHMVLDPSFRILAQNAAHARITKTDRAAIIGKLLFEVFPDNPNDSNADGLSALRASLVTVLRTRARDVMAPLKYDIKRPLAEGGGFEAHTWRVTNTPVLGEDGFVRLIVNKAEDISPG